jgi:hypothetical protein
VVEMAARMAAAGFEETVALIWHYGRMFPLGSIIIRTDLRAVHHYIYGETTFRRP